MVINLSELHGYYPNNDNYINEKLHIEKQCESLGMKYNRFPFNTHLQPRHLGQGTDFINLFELAIRNDIYPFMYMEDDATIHVEPPKQFKIPDNVTAIFWAGSIYECGGAKPTIKLENYNEDYYRIYYTLAPIVMIVPNKKAAEDILSIGIYALNKKEFWDIELAIKSSEYLFLTPKNGPYFYQNNYNTEVTKFLWKDLLK